MHTTKDVFDMPDDEVMNMTSAPVNDSVEQPKEPAPEEEPPAEETKPQEQEPVEQPQEEKEEEEEVPVEEPNPLGAADDKLEEPKPVEKPVEKPADQEKPAEQKPAEEAPKEETPKENEQAPAEEKKPEAQPLTLEQKAAALDGLMSFKANGKTITLTSPEEVLQLAQMGANYTRKMQQLQPMMRLHKMLENNKLLDPNELSYLIDLHQKKPEAIQKLLADSKFDPLTVDAEKAASYRPGNHVVSDTEVEFENTLKEVEASETGPELLTEIASKWDKDSRQALFQNPRLLAEINTQKSLGFYKVISDEVERRRMLGNLQGVPFIVAYEKVGNELNAAGKLVRPTDTPAPQPKEPESQKREPVEVRTATPAPKVKATEQAKAASAPKTVPGAKTQENENFLDMPDTQFLQQFEGRL